MAGIGYQPYISSPMTEESQKHRRVRKVFTYDEDQRLIEIMETQVFSTWNSVSLQLPGRSPRQCRDRWINYLSPSNRKVPWTEEEDLLLLEKYNELGPKWSRIAQLFDGRCDNSIKNRWNTHIKPRAVFDPYTQHYVIEDSCFSHAKKSEAKVIKKKENTPIPPEIHSPETEKKALPSIESLHIYMNPAHLRQSGSALGPQLIQNISSNELIPSVCPFSISNLLNVT